MNALIGKKVGMTRVYDDEGRQVAVTVVAVGPCTVVQRKTAARDGYEALQLGFEDRTAARLTKPMAGHFKKAGVGGKRVLREVRLEEGQSAKDEGQECTVADLAQAAYVDVRGISKGRGFQGVVRRWNMSGGRATHGSGTHRAPGSIGQNKEPSRVQKNKKMPGQMGHRKVTVQNLRVVAVRPEEGLLLLEGALPGPNGAMLLVRRALKKTTKAS